MSITAANPTTTDVTCTAGMTRMAPTTTLRTYPIARHDD